MDNEKMNITREENGDIVIRFQRSKYCHDAVGQAMMHAASHAMTGISALTKIIHSENFSSESIIKVAQEALDLMDRQTESIFKSRQDDD